MKPSGGTELLYHNLIKYVGQDWLNKINLILSICDPNLVNKNKSEVYSL